MDQPLVSIITPSFNQGAFIRATIEGVLSQDYPHIEYIIMDGASTDATASIVKEYAGRLTFISEKDKGQSHAINEGFRRARGDILAWLNSDDILLPGAVANAVAAFQQHPESGAVYGEGYLIDAAGNVKGRFPATEPFNLWKLIYLCDYILQQTVFFRRSVLDDVGLLDETLHWGLDWDLLIRIGKKYYMHYIPEYMGALREYEQAKTFSGGHRRFRELATIMRRHGHLRYPPGYFFYGLETYHRVLGRYLPFAAWRRALSRAAHAHIRRLCDAQGLYSDGWAARRLRYMLPSGTGGIRITGFLPEYRALRDQRLTVYRDGKKLGEQAVPFGEFAIEVEGSGASFPKPAYIEVTASSVLRSKGDRRKLAYMLRAIEWSKPQQRGAAEANCAPSTEPVASGP
jgi:glycosyltransferase involved in cell wall biosynthesis